MRLHASTESVGEELLRTYLGTRHCWWVWHKAVASATDSDWQRTAADSSLAIPATSCSCSQASSMPVHVDPAWGQSS